MSAHLYPDLDPALGPVVERLAEAFPEPEETLPIPEFRRRLEEMAAGQVTQHAPGMQVEDTHIASEGRTPRLRIYRPEGWSEGGAALLYFHGGGWVLGSIEGHDQVCTDLAAETGMAVASLDYALAPEHPYPAALTDCVAAFEHLLLGQSPLGRVGRLWVGGDSAGGNLALALCLKQRDTGTLMPAGQLLIYPCTGPDFTRPSYDRHAHAPFLSTLLMKRFWQIYLAGAAPDIYAAPALAEDLSGLPPAVVLTVALDPLVDEGDDMARALFKAKVPVLHHRANHLIHGFLRFRHASALAQDAFTWVCEAIRDTEEAGH